MSKFLILCDYPADNDIAKNLDDAHGQFVKYLFFKCANGPSKDTAIEFLYDSYADMCIDKSNESEIMAKHDPDVILAMGLNVIEALNISGKIDKMRGSVVELTKPRRDPYYVIPTYNPREMKQPIRNFAEEKMEKGVYTLHDMERAISVYRNGWSFPKENFNIEPTLEDVQQFVDDAIKNEWILGTDIEATGLDTDNAEIFVLGFAWSEEDAIVIPFLKENGFRYWSKSEWPIIEMEINRLFNHAKFIFQNGTGYDVPLLLKRGWDFKLENFLEDTMVLHHCLEGNTMIDTLDYGKVSIKSLEHKKDFWVVSYDEKLKKKVPAKANKCWKVRKDNNLVRVTFWNKDRAQLGDKNMYIDCTPDHKFLLKDGSWKEAGDLEAGDRLERGQTSRTQIDTKMIHRWVYEETTGECLKNFKIHHKDHNHFNNNPDNLQKVTKVQHNKLHKENQENATKVMMYKARRSREESADPDQVRNLYSNVGLSIREVAEALECSPDTIRTVMKDNNIRPRTKSEANKLRWQKARNCRVVSVTPLRGDYEIFDIEVDKTHNFSANGVIVHNCISPESPHNIGFISSIFGKQPLTIAA